MEHCVVQEILRKQHVVITDKSHRKQSFKDALLGIAPLKWRTGIQGEYVFVLSRRGNNFHIMCEDHSI